MKDSDICFLHFFYTQEIMLMIGAEGFRIVKKQNVLFHGIVDYEKAQKQHAEVVKALGAIRIPSFGLPDEVFVANTVLTLPMLPPTFIMANFKYAQRKKESENLAPYLSKMGKVIQWPYKSVLEGQGETKWFYGGKVVVVGYGFRSSKQSVSDLEEILNKIYKKHGLTPPVVIGVNLNAKLLRHENTILKYAFYFIIN